MQSHIRDTLGGFSDPASESRLDPRIPLDSGFSDSENPRLDSRIETRKVYDSILKIDDKDLNSFVQLVKNKLSHDDLLRLKIITLGLLGDGKLHDDLIRDIDLSGGWKEYATQFVDHNHLHPEIVASILKPPSFISGSGIVKFFKHVAHSAKRAGKSIQKAVFHNPVARAYSDFLNIGEKVLKYIPVENPEFKVGVALQGLNAAAFRKLTS